VHGQDVEVTSATIDTDSKVLALGIHADDGGMLVVGIPRMMLDAKGVQDGDVPFMVYADDKLIDHQQIDSDIAVRAISIEVPAGAESLVISGTNAIPEFGAVATIILAAGIIGIIATLRKANFLRI
jgi:predicted secreted protein with PEFG-CTERM motif